ncbi:MAG: EAL domain-containing protein [Desulfovibrionaceae bacterium]
MLLCMFVVMLLVPALGLVVHSGVLMRRGATESMQAELLRILRTVAARHEKALGDVRDIVLPLVLSPNPVQAGAACEPLVAGFFANHQEFASVSVVSENGDRLFQFVPPWVHRIEGAGALPFLATFAVDEPIDPTLGKGQYLRFNLAFNLDIYRSLLEDVRMPSGATVVLCTKAGDILYRYPDAPQWIGGRLPDDARAVLARDADELVSREVGLDGTPRLYAFKRLHPQLDSQGLYLRVGVPEAGVYAVIHRMTTGNVLGMLLLLLLALYVSRAMGRKLLLDPMKRLTRTADAIAQGHYDVRTGLETAGKEMVVLARAVDCMAHSLATKDRDTALAQDALARSEELNRALLNASMDSAMLIDPEGRMLALNNHAAARRGGTVELLVGTNLYNTLEPESAARRKEMVATVMETGHEVFFEEPRGGRYFRIRLFPVFDGEGSVARLASYSRDITERKLAEEELRRQAYTDGLTGLPNRSKFTEHLVAALDAAHDAPSRRYAMLFLDLDDFKLVNDSYGHLVGDELLQQCSVRLRDALPPAVLLSRFAGDEFAILSENVKDMFEVLKLAESVHNALATPFQLGNYFVSMSTAVGVVFSSPEYERPEQVLRDADIAMYRAKNQGKGHTEIFDCDMHTSVMQRLRMEQELRRAQERGELFVVYQPYYRSVDMSLAGFEALVRWRHPDMGVVSPAAFIPVAEETGSIISIGRFVLDEACAWMGACLRAHPALEHCVMNVNLSGRQLMQIDPVQQILAALQGAVLSPRNLKVEITESVIMQDVALAVDVLDAIRSVGVRIALDDFGTGYSSLGSLRDMPIDTVKVDQSFVRRMAAGDKERRLVHRIVDLAHTLGMDVVAEGVECEAEAVSLASFQCECLQGYHMSKPLSAEDALALAAVWAKP